MSETRKAVVDLNHSFTLFYRLFKNICIGIVQGGSFPKKRLKYLPWLNLRYISVCVCVWVSVRVCVGVCVRACLRAYRSLSLWSSTSDAQGEYRWVHRSLLQHWRGREGAGCVTDQQILEGLIKREYHCHSGLSTHSNLELRNLWM